MIKPTGWYLEFPAIAVTKCFTFQPALPEVFLVPLPISSDHVFFRWFAHTFDSNMIESPAFVDWIVGTRMFLVAKLCKLYMIEIFEIPMLDVKIPTSLAKLCFWGSAPLFRWLPRMCQVTCWTRRICRYLSVPSSVWAAMCFLQPLNSSWNRTQAIWMFSEIAIPYGCSQKLRYPKIIGIFS